MSVTGLSSLVDEDPLLQTGRSLTDVIVIVAVWSSCPPLPSLSSKPKVSDP